MVPGDLKCSLINPKKCGLTAKFSLAFIVACEVAKKPQIFLTISNQHIQ